MGLSAVIQLGFRKLCVYLQLRILQMISIGNVIHSLFLHLIPRHYPGFPSERSLFNHFIVACKGRKRGELSRPHLLRHSGMPGGSVMRQINDIAVIVRACIL